MLFCIKPRLQNVLCGLISALILLQFQNCSEVAFQDQSAKQPQTNQDFGTGFDPPQDGGHQDEDNSHTDAPDVPDDNDRLFPKLDSWASIAYEDIFPRDGDLDFNDAVFNFYIVEKIDRENNMNHIRIEGFTRARMAGYDHQLLLVMDGVKDGPSNLRAVTEELFYGSGSAEVNEYSATGEHLDRRIYDKVDDVILVKSTKQAYNNGKPNKFTLDIIVDNPKANPRYERDRIDIFLYRFVLHVKDSKQDIDLAEINREDGMIDRRGFPRAFLIPTDWAYPGEGRFIESLYPNFSHYRDWLLKGAQGPKSKLAEKWFE